MSTKQKWVLAIFCAVGVLLVIGAFAGSQEETPASTTNVAQETATVPTLVETTTTVDMWPLIARAAVKQQSCENLELTDYGESLDRDFVKASIEEGYGQTITEDQFDTVMEAVRSELATRC